MVVVVKMKKNIEKEEFEERKMSRAERDLMKTMWFEEMLHLWNAEKRLLGESMSGPRGRMMPPSLTHCR